MDTETIIYNTKDKKALATTYTYPDFCNEVTPDYEDLVDCTCGLMSAKDSCIVNYKVMVFVKNVKLMKVNFITIVGLLRSCYAQHGRIKLFAKLILTTPINICYNNVEPKVLSFKKADKKRLKIKLDILRKILMKFFYRKKHS